MVDKKLLIAHSNPKSPVSEAFRVLRTNIQFSSLDKHLKVLLVTSPGTEEGKTTITSNLAVTMAQAGSKVLVIDADLRKPKIHKMFGISNEKGLTNSLLSMHDSDKDFIQSTEIENIHVITSGPIPPNPSELLGSTLMKEFLQELKEPYNFILIDTPPVCTVTDAAVLSTITDGVILVANSGKVEIKAAQKAKESLLKVNANIIGVVLNNIFFNQDDYYYNYCYSEKINENKKKKQKRLKKAAKND